MPYMKLNNAIHDCAASPRISIATSSRYGVKSTPNQISSNQKHSGALRRSVFLRLNGALQDFWLGTTPLWERCLRAWVWEPVCRRTLRVVYPDIVMQTVCAVLIQYSCTQNHFATSSLAYQTRAKTKSNQTPCLCLHAQCLCFHAV